MQWVNDVIATLQNKSNSCALPMSIDSYDWNGPWFTGRNTALSGYIRSRVC